MLERRRALRHDISLPVKWNWILKKKRKQAPVPTRTVNVSANGLMFNQLLEKDEHLSISITLPSLQKPIDIKGRIVTRTPKGSGVEFFGDKQSKEARAIIGKFIEQEHSSDLKSKQEDFLSVIRSHKINDREILEKTYYVATKILLHRTEHLGKPIKRKDICQAVDVVRQRIDKGYIFELKDELLENLGSCDYAKAVEYYEKKVIGKYTDIYGRTIQVDEEGMTHLFKEPLTNKHDLDMKTENYVEPRGKRLPWIKHLITQSKEIYEYVDDRRKERTYYFVGQTLVKTDTGKTWNYYLVVTRQNAGEGIIFKTAYSFDDETSLIRSISAGRVFKPSPTWEARNDALTGTA